jgi:EAL domain-containing protein (putative c-di-GMP-specific phosphodiesterase class I)
VGQAFLPNVWAARLSLDPDQPAGVTSVRANALVSSTIALAHSLGLRMIAEGVDNDAALAELARYGWDEVQGYYISRPVPANDLNDWLDLHQRLHQRACSHLPLLTGPRA